MKNGLIKTVVGRNKKEVGVRALIIAGIGLGAFALSRLMKDEKKQDDYAQVKVSAVTEGYDDDDFEEDFEEEEI